MDLSAQAKALVQGMAPEISQLKDSSEGFPAEGKIEAQILSFLSQLAAVTKNHGEEECCSPKQAGRPKVELRLTNRRTGEHRTLRYPRKSHMGSARPLAQAFRIMDLSHEAISKGIPMTKRDLYYNDMPLFRSQRVVDRLVDDLAATMDLERADLHIRASSKGLVCGTSLAIHLITGERLQCNDAEGTLIPVGEDVKSFEIAGDLLWVLVVEKEAVFQTLCKWQLSKHSALLGPGLIITGKGYPDMATRYLLKMLSDCLPSGVPILALVDGDPYGIDIMATYKYGSQSLAHEAEKIAAKRVKWLGLWASELNDLGIDKGDLIPITRHDEKKAHSILQRHYLPRRWRKELMHMLHTRRKAEIEVLSNALTVVDPDRGTIEGVGPIAEAALKAHRTAPAERPPLLQYLLLKIMAEVEKAQKQEGQLRG